MGAGFAPDRNKCPGLSPARAWRRCAAEGEERVAGSWGDVRPAPPYCQRLRSVSGSRVAARPVARELTRDAARARCPIQRPAQGDLLRLFIPVRVAEFAQMQAHHFQVLRSEEHTSELQSLMR